MDAAILDTDILSEVLKRKDQQVLTTARNYLIRHRRFAFSAMSMYEVVRGLWANGATRRLAAFQQTVASSDVFEISTNVLMRAAELWAEAHTNGHPRNDADLIIAATALEEGRVLATGNTAHYAWIAGIRLSDWRSSTP